MAEVGSGRGQGAQTGNGFQAGGVPGGAVHVVGADAVLLFGSWAARYLGEDGRAPNDIDVLVIGNADRDQADDAAERAERRIGMPVNATVRSRSQWESAAESFIEEVKSRPLLVMLNSDDEQLAAELAELTADRGIRE